MKFFKKIILIPLVILFLFVVCSFTAGFIQIVTGIIENIEGDTLGGAKSITYGLLTLFLSAWGIVLSIMYYGSALSESFKYKEKKGNDE